MEGTGRSGKGESKMSIMVYEHVLARNFEIIESFLSKFHEIFHKQQEFEELLRNLQNKLVEVEILNSRLNRLQDSLTKASALWEDKLSTLKDFFLEEIHISDKTASKEGSPPVKEELGEGDQRKDLLVLLEGQKRQQKRMEDNLLEKIYDLDSRISETTTRLNSAHAYIENVDIRVKENDGSCNSAYMKTLQNKIESEIFALKQKLALHQPNPKETLAPPKPDPMIDFQTIIATTKKLEEECSLKPSQCDIQQLYQQMTLNFQRVSDQIGECVSKKQNRQCLLLINRKIQKLQLIEQLLQKPDKDIISVVPAPCSAKKRPATIHGFKEFSRSFHKGRDKPLIKKTREPSSLGWTTLSSTASNENVC